METFDARALLERFLSTPLSSSDGVFSLFAALPEAMCGSGSAPKQRYVYVPGTRPDRVLLVAHADTVWDAHYGHAADHALPFENGVFYSDSPTCGIGADDRAGCAMLYALRRCGHSLLLLDGEERGKIGARYIRQQNKRLFRELNRHAFMIELDWCGTDGCLYNQVDNTAAFMNYIENELGFRDSRKKGGCDLQIP